MSTQPSQARQQPIRKKVIHQLETPFSAVLWPEITSEVQDTILELLCSLLAPIGHYRQNNITRSKGKKAKRKLKSEAAASANDGPVPPEPPITSYVDVGFNCIIKSLQSACASQGRTDTPTEPLRTYVAVFVARGDQSAAFNCHFPRMVGAATSSRPEENTTRLVGFSRTCSEKLSLALGIPRVSTLALVAGAPGAKALEDLVRNSVPAIDIAWLPSPEEEAYHPTKINSIETKIGNKKMRVT